MFGHFLFECAQGWTFLSPAPSMSLLASVSKCVYLQSSGLLVHVMVPILGLVALLAMPSGQAPSSNVRRHRPRGLFTGSTIGGNSTSTTTGALSKSSALTNSWTSPMAVLIVLVVALLGLCIYLGVSNRRKSKTNGQKNKDQKRNQKNKLRPHQSTKESPVGKPSTQPPSSPKTPGSPNRDGGTNKDLTQVVHMYNRILKHFGQVNCIDLETGERLKYYGLKAELKKVQIELKQIQTKKDKIISAPDYERLMKKLFDLAQVCKGLMDGGKSNRKVGTGQSEKGTDDSKRQAVSPKGTKKIPKKTELEPTQSELKSSSGIDDSESSVILMPKLGPETKKNGSEQEEEHDEQSNE